MEPHTHKFQGLKIQEQFESFRIGDGLFVFHNGIKQDIKLILKRLIHSLPKLGLGLAIVKQLVELLGGCIYVDSNLGEWTKFVIECPGPASLVFDWVWYALLSHAAHVS